MDGRHFSPLFLIAGMLILLIITPPSARSQDADTKTLWELTDIAENSNAQGHYDCGLTTSGRCIELSPFWAPCHFEMGKSFEGIGREEVAIGKRSEALEEMENARKAYLEAIVTGQAFGGAFIDRVKEKLARLAETKDSILASNPSPVEAQPSEPAVVAGSGFFISNRGYILTNNHVVANCKQIQTTFVPITEWDEFGNPIVSKSEVLTVLRVVASNADSDLALLKPDSGRIVPSTIATFRIPTGPSPRAGDSVVAFGFPLPGILSSEGNVSTGTITAMSGMGDDPRFLQISAPVQPGNSGGPLLDSSGNVIGVVVAKLDAVKIAQATGDIPENVNFAVQLSEVRRFLDDNHIPYTRRSSVVRSQTADIAALAKQFSVAIECKE